MCVADGTVSGGDRELRQALAGGGRPLERVLPDLKDVNGLHHPDVHSFPVTRVTIPKPLKLN